MSSPAFDLLLITPDDSLTLDELADRVAAALDVAPAAILLRRKQMAQTDGRAFLSWAERLRHVTSQRRAALIIHDRLDVALAVGADGVHLPGGATVRRAGSLIVGSSTHRLDELPNGADYVTFGPVFAPRSKKSDRPPTGVARLGDAVKRAGVPVFALGGIDADNAVACRGVGARLACITEVLGQPTAQVAAAMRRLAGLAA